MFHLRGAPSNVPACQPGLMLARIHTDAQFLPSRRLPASPPTKLGSFREPDETQIKDQKSCAVLPTYRGYTVERYRQDVREKLVSLHSRTFSEEWDQSYKTSRKCCASKPSFCLLPPFPFLGCIFVCSTRDRLFVCFLLGGG